MNVSYLWLKDYVRTDLAPREAAARLTSVGLNVDDLTELPGGDVRLLVEVTSNRPDCLGHLGVARELAAALGVRTAVPEVTYAELPDATASLTRVEVMELDLCPLYTARVIRGVRVAPSPDWLTRRLEAVGIRPVNNIVDVTNYVMMECGQPLHAFDYARLAENRIIVRRAMAGERFVSIDHTEHTLTPDRLVIADSRRAVALAGVMGGAETEISGATVDVLLESAVFDPLNIRTTARTLAVATEASYRLERRVDPCGTDWASRRACQLIVQVAGGRVATGVVTAGRPLPTPSELVLRVPRIQAILGIAVPAAKAAEILRSLECDVLEATAERIRVRVPSWRPDLEREIDLIEEVARHYGYDKIPEGLETRLSLTSPSKTERVREMAAQVLCAAGYFEAVTFTFTTRDHAMRFRPQSVTADPLMCRGTPLAVRQSCLAGVVESLRVNRNAGEAAARLYEVAKRFIPVEGRELPQEEAVIAMAGPDDFSVVRGTLDAMFSALRIGGRITFAATERFDDLAPGSAAEILLDGQPIGMIGRATPAAAAAFELDDPPMVAEVLFAPLVEAAQLQPKYKPLPQFPAMVRDLAIVVDEAVTWAEIQKAVAPLVCREPTAGVPRAASVSSAVSGNAAGAGGQSGVLAACRLESVEPVDVYRGKQVPPGKKSVAIRLTLRSTAGTLTHDEADATQAEVLAAIAASVGGTLRT
jgi:phenylalanyl-tRNA synthetase beta chain